MSEIKIAGYSHTNTTIAEYQRSGLDAAVKVSKSPEGVFAIQFVIESEEDNLDKPRAIHEVVEGNKVCTTIGISAEGATALYVCLRERLLAAGVLGYADPKIPLVSDEEIDNMAQDYRQRVGIVTGRAEVVHDFLSGVQAYKDKLSELLNKK